MKSSLSKSLKFFWWTYAHCTGVGFICVVAVFLGMLLVLVHAQMGAVDVQLVDARPQFPTRVINNIRRQSVDLFFDLQFGDQESRGKARAWATPVSGLFVTNYHVVKHACKDLECPNTVVTYMPSGNEFNKARVATLSPVYCSAAYDLCLLASDDVSEDSYEKFFDFEVGPELSAGDRVYVVPHREDIGGKPFELIEGRVTNTGGFLIDLEMPARKGYSGSPVFDENGKVVAIISEISDDDLAQFLWGGFGFYVARSRAVSLRKIDQLRDCVERNPSCGRSYMSAVLGSFETASDRGFYELLSEVARLVNISFDINAVTVGYDLKWIASEPDLMTARDLRYLNGLEAVYNEEIGRSPRDLFHDAGEDRMLLAMLGIIMTCKDHQSRGRALVKAIIEKLGSGTSSGQLIKRRAKDVFGKCKIPSEVFCDSVTG